MPWWESPISVFQDAFTSTFGRVVSFILVWWFASGVGIVVDPGNWPDPGPLMLEVPIWGGYLTLMSLLYGWGLIPAVLLAVAFVYLMASENSQAFTLLFVFLVQSITTLLMLLETPPRTWPFEVKGFVASWFVLLLVWVLRVIVSRWSMATLGPLNTLLLGREPAEEAYDHEPPSREDHERLEWTEVEESSDGE